MSLKELSGPVLQVAPTLLGATISSTLGGGTVTVRLTEVEAYDGANDPGSHAYRGQTARTAVMFGPAGHLYVYFTYGMHFCANVTTGVPGAASAVLMRAGEVVDGIELARTRRPSAKHDRELARGPARLAQCLGLNREHNGLDLRKPPVTLHLPSTTAPEIRHGPRVGVSGPGGDGDRFPWRFWLPDEPTVSVYRPAQRKRRAASS